ncbi:hypothetical protein T439DRAFT_356402 [Meredithblackwellia eburnea MCA 4105]
MSTRRAQLKHPCVHCDDVAFDGSQKLDEHYVGAHGETEEAAEAWERMKHRCQRDECNYRTHRLTNMLRHLVEVHSREKWRTVTTVDLKRKDKYKKLVKKRFTSEFEKEKKEEWEKRQAELDDTSPNGTSDQSAKQSPPGNSRGNLHFHHFADANPIVNASYAADPGSLHSPSGPTPVPSQAANDNNRFRDLIDTTIQDAHQVQTESSRDAAWSGNPRHPSNAAPVHSSTNQTAHDFKRLHQLVDTALMTANEVQAKSPQGADWSSNSTYAHSSSPHQPVLNPLHVIAYAASLQHPGGPSGEEHCLSKADRRYLRRLSKGVPVARNWRSD